MPRISPAFAFAAAFLLLPLALAQPKPDAPAVDAGTVIGDFEIDADAAASLYTTTVITLQGRVTSVNVRTANGKTFVDLLLTSSRHTNLSVPIHLAFADTFADQVKKLKVDDLIEARSTYHDFPAIGQPRQISQFLGTTLKVTGHGIVSPVDENLTTWVRDNNAFGPKSPLVEDMTKTIAEETAKDENFSITFGPALMKSGKATILGAQDGQMFTLPLTDAQAKALNIDKSSAGVAPSGPSQARPIEVTMTTFTLDGGGTWQSGKPLTGKIVYQAPRSLLHLPGDYAIRLSCDVGGQHCDLYSYFAATPTSKDVNTISFTDAKSTLPPGPHLVLFQFVRMFHATGEPPVEQVISEPKAMIIDVKGK